MNTPARTRIFRLLAPFAVAGLLAVVPPGAAAQGTSAKLDATLMGIAQKGKVGVGIKPKLLPVEPGKAEPFVATILRFEGSLDAVEAQGAVVRSVMGNIATVDIPVDKIATVAALPSVVSIEAARPVRPRLDVSVPATRADTLRTGTPGNWTGGTGRGVIVGVVDDGLDFRHRDFRNTDGTTRLLGLWDQRVSGAAGTPPAGFNYGGVCTPAMINDAINGNAAACTQPSSGGHGTHVGGIAAGTGQATGNGQLAYRMIGMAPDADLLVANSITGGVGGTDAVVDGITWMKARAASLGKPLVVNLSLGSYFGARDGTSNFEQALNNLAGAGVILVGAAGNESDQPIRATGTIAQGGAASVGFDVPGAVTQGQLELWYPGANSYGVNLTGPGCATTVTVNPGQSTGAVETPCGVFQIDSTLTQANNDDRQILVNLGSSASSPLKAGAWTLTLIGDTVAGGSSEFSIVCAEDGQGLKFTTNSGPAITGILTDVSGAKRVIAVAAYTTRYSWNSLAGPFTQTSDFGALNDIASFSSRGPRRSCSNATKCPPVMKPEIAAPGAMIMSAYASDTAEASAQNVIEADGVHVAFNGTSMATPHVSGAVALLLQRQPTLTPEEVKTLLFANVQTNAFTTGLPVFDTATPDFPANPNYAWGYGPLDIAKAVGALSGASTASNYEGMWWNAPANSESGWGINFAHQADTIFATWFTFGTDNKPLWLVVGANKTAANVYSGKLYTGTGPAFNSVPFDPAKVAALEVGTATFTFTDDSNAVFDYTINDVPGKKNITRQQFGSSMPTCVWSAQADFASATNYQDMWWNAPAGSESGWGVNFAHQGDTIFATWFTYGLDGNPLWLVVGAPKTADKTYAGKLYAVTGPAYSAVPFDPNLVAGTEVGTATITFADGGNATFSYTVNGVSQTKNVIRQIFAAAGSGTVCR